MQKMNISRYFLIAALLLVNFKSVYPQNIDHWEMVVAANDVWHYFPGISEPPANWADTDFDESSWLSGPGGIGYGDGDDGTIINSVYSVYVRTNFTLTDTSDISWAILHVDYDDAFVAYLNGHEIARANIGTAGVRPAFSATSISDHEAVMNSGGIPERFIIQKDTLKKYITQGNNVLALQVHNFSITSSDLSSTTFFSVGIKDTGLTYRQVPDWFDDPMDQKTNLPLLIINTNGQTIPDEPKITASLKVVDNGPGQLNGILDDATDYVGNIGIETRGQSSQMFPKKSFSVELWTNTLADTSVSLLGMPADEDWILYAPYSDKSMLRNAITYQLGSKMGAWQPRFKWCEVYMNGTYHGVYMLVEKIKRGAERVDINKLKPDEISGDDLTGGYIVKVDKIDGLGSNEYFYSHPSIMYPNSRNYAFTYVYPKYNEIVPQQKLYIQNYLATLENTLNGTSFQDTINGFRKFLDINSFVDFQIINELANNVDGYRYSTFFYKKRDSDGGKLFAGPLWDFDLSYGNVDYSPSNLATDEWLYDKYGPYVYNPMHWWARLMQDADYRKVFIQRWKTLRSSSFSTYSINTDLDQHSNYLGEAIARNFERWPILGQYVWPNYFVGTTYQQEIDYLKSWLLSRCKWMDANVELASGITDNSYPGNSILVYPNPVKDNLNIYLNTLNANPIHIEIIDLPGKVVYNSEYTSGFDGEQTIQLNLNNLSPGYYILKLTQKKQIIGSTKLIVL
jgi:hypothetical protein